MTSNKKPCVECGDPNTVAGWCDLHRPKNLSQEQLWVLSGRKRREKAGICCKCQNKALPGKRHCKLHERKINDALTLLHRDMVRNAVARAKKEAEARQDKESLFLDPDFEAKNPELAGVLIKEEEEDDD